MYEDSFLIHIFSMSVLKGKSFGVITDSFSLSLGETLVDLYGVIDINSEQMDGE